MQSLAEAPLLPRSLALCVLVVSADNAREEIKNNDNIYKFFRTFTNKSDAYFLARHNPRSLCCCCFLVAAVVDKLV